MVKSARKNLLSEYIKSCFERSMSSRELRFLDPYVLPGRPPNPRYQEAALTFIAGKKLGLAEECGLSDVDLDTAAGRALEGWFKLQKRNGAVVIDPEIGSDSQATAYGSFAVAKTLLGNG